MKKIAIVGAMSDVGREILTFFEVDKISPTEIFAVDLKKPIGTQVSYGEDFDLDVYNLDDFDFSKVEYAIFVSSKAASKKYVPKALAKKVKVIDASGEFTLDQDTPVVVYGVNDGNIKRSPRGLIAIPSALSAQLATALKSIDDKYLIKRILTSSYISTSYYGREGMDELFSQTKKIYSNTSLAENKEIFNKQIAFNVVPQVDEFIGDETKAEWLVSLEIKKILGMDIKIHSNCAVVPTFVGIAQFVNVEVEEEIDVSDARELMSATDGIVVFDKTVDGGYVSMTDVQGEDNLYISRLRQDLSVENGISFWAVSDNLRFGIARNTFLTLKKFMKQEV